MKSLLNVILCLYTLIVSIDIYDFKKSTSKAIRGDCRSKTLNDCTPYSQDPGPQFFASILILDLEIYLVI